MTDKTNELHFEEGIRRLDTIAAELDRGSIDLEEAIKLYREGCQLAGLLDERLNRAERMLEEAPLRGDETANSETDLKPFAGLTEDSPKPAQKNSRVQKKSADDNPDLLPF